MRAQGVLGLLGRTKPNDAPTCENAKALGHMGGRLTFSIRVGLEQIFSQHFGPSPCTSSAAI